MLLQIRRDRPEKYPSLHGPRLSVEYLMGDYEEAIRSFDMAIKLNVLDADAWCNKGLALKAAGRYSEEDQALLTALELARSILTESETQKQKI